jgi:hypothetical protein
MDFILLCYRYAEINKPLACPPPAQTVAQLGVTLG